MIRAATAATVNQASVLPTISPWLKYHHPSSPGKRRLGSAALVDRLLAQNHPDKVAHLDDLRDLAERKIRAIIEAYEALQSARRR
jgi:hypothetical protein